MIISCVANARINADADHLNNVEEYDLIDFSYQGLSVLPEFIVKNAHLVKHLILDGNKFDEHVFDDVRFPVLETLSFNCNQITNIGVFINLLSHKCPKLCFLSLIDNPGWPHPIRTSDNFRLYKSYIKTVLKFFPNLRFLDSTDIRNQRKTSTVSCTSVASNSSSTSSCSSKSSRSSRSSK